jgi:phosphoesterase RecJ-like protein
MGAELFKDTSAEATGRLVFEAAEHLGVDLSPAEATPLFAALSTDTGWFRFPSVTALTYRTAASLIEAGAVPSDLYGRLYERETFGRVRLRGLVLARVEAEFDGRLAHTFIRPEDYETAGALTTDTEDLINLLLEIEGTCFAVIFVGQIDGGYKISFRSRCGVACNEVAAEFGGGGHKAAAGAFFDGSLEVVSQAVLGHVRNCLRAEFSAQA